MMISINLVGGKLDENKVLVGGSITGSANGKSFGVKYTKEKYEAMKVLADKANQAEKMDELNNILAEFEPFTHDGYKETVETACPNLLVNEETGKFYLKTTDGKTISTKPLPQPLVDRILVSVEKGIDFIPIVKFWTRFLRMFATRGIPYDEVKATRLANYVNKTVVDYELKAELEKQGVAPSTALERATVADTPITMEGLLATYKVSKEITHKFDKETGKVIPRNKTTYDEDTGDAISEAPDHVEDRLFEPAVQGNSGDPFYCYTIDQVAGGAKAKPKPGHFIRVGCVHELESWDNVNCNDSQSCVKGLHAGGRTYIKGYAGQAGTVTHEVFIDPSDIGAITDDGSGALRVRKYYTHKSNAGINRSIYHSSKYAAMNDQEWDAIRSEAIKATEAKAEIAAKEAEDTAAI
jgi:hypothetical protein